MKTIFQPLTSLVAENSQRHSSQRQARKRFTALDLFPEEAKHDETHPLSMQQKIKHRIYKEKPDPRPNRFEDLNPGPVPRVLCTAVSPGKDYYVAKG